MSSSIVSAADCDFESPESDYAIVFESFPQPMWVFDRRTLQFLAVNHSAVRQYGYDRSDFLDMKTSEIETAVAARHCTKDGTLIDVELSHAPATFQGRAAEIVLAINVTERRRHERDLSVQYEVARIVSECRTIEIAAPRILAAICRSLNWQYGALWRVAPVEHVLRRVAAWCGESAALLDFTQTSERMTMARGVGLPGYVWMDAEPVWLPDVMAARGDYPRAAAAARAGLHAAFGIPIALAGEILAVMEFSSDTIQEPDTSLLEVMAAIGVKIGFYFERLKAEADTQDSERRFRRLFEDSPVAYCEMDAVGMIRRVNRAECEMLGLPAEHLLGRPAWDLAVPEKREEWIEFFRDPQSHFPLPSSVEVDYVRPDRVPLTFAVYPRIMEEMNGTFAGIRSARLDITVLKQAERERAQQRRFEELISDITDAFVTHNGVEASLQHCAEAVVWRLDGALARIWTMKLPEKILELQASAGVSTRTEAGETKVAEIATERQACLSNAVSGDPMFELDWVKQDGLAGFAGYPLLVNEETVGVLALFSRQPITDEVFQALGKAALEIAVVIERKSAEKALRDSEKRYRRLVETAAEGIWVADKAGRATFVNQRMGELLGSDVEDVIGKTGFDYVLDEDRELVARTLASLERGNREIFDFRLRRLDGSLIWASLCAAPILEGDGRFAGSLIMFTDITQRKQMEDALRASEEFNKGIVESTSDGILVLDLSAHFQYMSPAAKLLLDYENEADCVAGSWVEFWTGANLKKLEAALARGAAGESSSFEGSCLTVKGGTRLLEVSLSAIRGGSGAAPRLVAILRDIATRKQLEGQLTQALKLESIGQLAAGVAHEINTPIQYIGDNARFLQESFRQLQPMLEINQLPAEHQGDAEFLIAEIPKAAGQLLEGVEQVARIVGAMKEFSHPGPVDKITIDLNRAIQSTIVVSRNEWKYVADMVDDLDAALPQVLCMPGEINQVILNLIVNAAHAIGDRIRGSELRGSITVLTRRDGDWVDIRVRDTGTGIPESARARVFDPFFTTKEVGKGTGQGLAIAHTVVVKNHGGTIRFETEVGVGTTFIVRLPIAGN